MSVEIVVMKWAFDYDSPNDSTSFAQLFMLILKSLPLNQLKGSFGLA